MILMKIRSVGEPVTTRQSRTSHVRQYIPPDSMRIFSRRWYRTPPRPKIEENLSRRSAFLIVECNMLTHVNQPGTHYISTKCGNTQYARQHEEGSRDVCREREGG